MWRRIGVNALVRRVEQELARVAADLGREYPETDGGRRLMLVPAAEQLVGSVARPMWVVLLASALVVFGASINVGNLLLVRQAGRRREFAIRSALTEARKISDEFGVPIEAARLLYIDATQPLAILGSVETPEDDNAEE